MYYNLKLLAKRVGWYFGILRDDVIGAMSRENIPIIKADIANPS
jgi:hypothetical protein